MVRLAVHKHIRSYTGREGLICTGIKIYVNEEGVQCLYEQASEEGDVCYRIVTDDVFVTSTTHAALSRLRSATSASQLSASALPEVVEDSKEMSSSSQQIKGGRSQIFYVFGLAAFVSFLLLLLCSVVQIPVQSYVLYKHPYSFMLCINTCSSLCSV